MDALGNGLVALFNGLLNMASAVVSPFVASALVITLCFVWFGLIELDELDRTGVRPTVGMH